MHTRSNVSILPDPALPPGDLAPLTMLMVSTGRCIGGVRNRVIQTLKSEVYVD